MNGTLLGMILGIAFTVAGWVLSRLVADANWRRPWACLLDIIPPLLCFAFFLALTARPIFAGIMGFALGAGFAFADREKRRRLREPIVFADIAETFDIVRHPRICLLFPQVNWVFAGIGVVFALLAALFVLDPPAWSWSPWPPALLAGLVGLAWWLVANPGLDHIAARLGRFGLINDPFADAATLGAFALQFCYWLLARADRARLRGRALRHTATEAGRQASGGPIVLVQCESFVDPRRMHAGIARDLLPTFDAHCRRSVQFGRFAVPSWGANTARTEFAVLSGLAQSALGFDRFNPYRAFARSPIPSLASRLREQGYRTICIHPFDRTFYRRDLVMPQLGFDVFMGGECFVGARRNGLYVADTEVARLAVQVLREQGPNVFVFAITMENHGPWCAAKNASGRDPAPGLPRAPEHEAMRRFLQGIEGADAMLRILTDELSAQEAPGLLAFYGDHPPSLPKTFARLGFEDKDSDYLLWRTERGAGIRRDIAAHDLADMIWLAATAPARGREAEQAAYLFDHAAEAAAE